MKLRTPRLELIAATPELLRAELASTAGLARMLDVAEPARWPPGLNTRETVEYTLRFLEGGPGREGWMSWYYVLREGRALVGLGGYAGTPANGSVELGYSVLEEHQRLGYAVEATAALIARAFESPEIQRVTAQTLPELAPSIRVLERLGFTFTGPGAEEGVILYTLARAAWGTLPRHG